jgi:mono/diheme cytochrome c family protein
MKYPARRFKSLALALKEIEPHVRDGKHLQTGKPFGNFADMRSREDRIERGRYLAVLSDCAACHTLPGGAPFAGGLALQTPFGTLVAPNITSDPDTGIGTMSNDEFLAALREGRGHNGERLYPAMPYTAYTKMTDDDVLAMRAYFATVAPVRNQVVSNQLPFPLNIRLAMVFWNALNFTPGRYQPNSQKSAAWNRGAYIVEGAAHCGTCHTPKTMLGGDKDSAALTGATLQGWFAPDITNDPRKGIGGWSKDDLVQYLKTGTNKWTLASGPMAEAVSHSTSRMADDDILAIATYLKDSGEGGSAAKPEPVAANSDTMRAGAAIYKDSCAVCHKDSGEGEINLFPRLAHSALVQSDDPTTLARVVLQGTRAVSTSSSPTAPAMPAFDWRLSDAQAAAVLTYVRNSWGNEASPISAGVLASQRKSLAKGR